MKPRSTFPTPVVPALFAALMGGTCGAQAVFSSNYAVGYNNISWVRGVAKADGGLMVSARPTGDSTAQFASSILTTDNAGNVISLLRYENGGPDLISCMEGTTGGDVIVGSVSSGHFPGEPEADIMVRRILPDGDVVWAKAYAVEGEAMTALYDVVQPSPGFFVGVGSSTDQNNAGHPLLFGFTGSGEVLWAKALHAPDAGMQCYTLTTDPDGGVIATGRLLLGGNGMKMLVVHVDLDGNVDWSHWYGDSGNSEASVTLTRPDGGFAILGNLQGIDGHDGAVVRIDPDGVPLSMVHWGNDVAVGHCFSDGSMMLMSQSPGGKAAFARIDTNNTILWSTLLDATSWGELVPLPLPTLGAGDNIRFAYVSSELFSDVTINTLTAECQACANDPIPFTEVAGTWADDGPAGVYALPVNMVNADIPTTPVLLSAIMSQQCMLSVGVEEEPRSQRPKVNCGFDAARQVLTVTGLGPKAGSIVVSDMLGHQWPTQSNGDMQLTDGNSLRVSMKNDPGPGYYVASLGPGNATCAFIVRPQ